MEKSLIFIRTVFATAALVMLMIAPAVRAQTEILTNDEVVAMLKAGLSSTVIVAGLTAGTSIAVGGTSAVIAAPQQIPPVPEPSSLIVVGLGGAALAFWAVRRRRTAHT